MPSKWIDHVKSYASEHKMSYKDALKDPKCKESYKSSGSGIGFSVPVADEQEIIKQKTKPKIPKKVSKLLEDSSNLDAFEWQKRYDKLSKKEKEIYTTLNTKEVRGKGPTSSRVAPINPTDLQINEQQQKADTVRNKVKREYGRRTMEKKAIDAELSITESPYEKILLNKRKKDVNKYLNLPYHKKAEKKRKELEAKRVIPLDTIPETGGNGLRAIARKMHGKGSIKGGKVNKDRNFDFASLPDSEMLTMETHRNVFRLQDQFNYYINILSIIEDNFIIMEEDRYNLENDITNIDILISNLNNTSDSLTVASLANLDNVYSLFERAENKIQEMISRFGNDIVSPIEIPGNGLRSIARKMHGKGPVSPEIVDSSQRSSIITNLRNLLANISINLLRMEEDGYRISMDDIVESDFRYTDMEILIDDADDMPEDQFLTQIRIVTSFINRMRQRYGRDITDVIEGGKINIALNKLLYKDEMLRRRREGNVPNVIVPEPLPQITQEQILQQIRERQRQERERLQRERINEERERVFMNLEDSNALQPITNESIEQQLQSLQELLNSYGQRQTGGAIKDLVSPSAWKDYATSVIKGRKAYPPKMREIITKYGDKPIMRMQACRTPLSSFMTTALNIASLGEFNKRFANMPHDKLFHLDLRVEIADDTGKRKQLTTILLEKTEVLNASVNPTKKSDTECSLIQFRKPLTINQMLEGAKKIQGDKFFKYSANNNNCQDFIMALLKGVGAGNQQNYDFVKQDTQELFKGLPFFRKLTNTVTDVGAKFNEIIEGSGKMIKGKGINLVDAMTYLVAGIMGFSSVAALLNHIDDRLNRARRQVAPEVVAVLEDVAEDIENRLQAGQPISEILAEARRAADNERGIQRNDSWEMSINTIPEEEVTEIPSATAVRAPETTGGKIKKSSSYYVQTIIFDKSKFDKKSASDWIKKYDYENKGIDEKEDTLRFRQVDPDYIKKKGFDKFRTKKMGKDSGISFVLAYK